jgi:hypothetical protein
MLSPEKIANVTELLDLLAGLERRQISAPAFQVSTGMV